MRKHRRIKDDYDILFIPYSGGSRFVVFLSYFLTNKMILWDAFFSLYDSWVFDRKYVDRYSLKSFVYWFYDWLGCAIADKVLLDTNEHIEYFIKTFKIKRESLLEF